MNRVRHLTAPKNPFFLFLDFLSLEDVIKFSIPTAITMTIVGVSKKIPVKSQYFPIFIIIFVIFERTKLEQTTLP